MCLSLPVFPGTAIGKQNEGQHTLPPGTEHWDGNSHGTVHLTGHPGIYALWG